MEGLWDDSFGQIGAVLRILDLRGVTPTDLELIRENPDTMGKDIAEFIQARSILQAVKYEGSYGPSSEDNSAIAKECGFTNQNSFEYFDIQALNDPAIKAITTNWPLVGVFLFKPGHFKSVNPSDRLNQVFSRISKAGYTPAPLRLFLMYVRDNVKRFSRETALWKIRPLVCLDHHFEVTGSFPCVVKKRFDTARKGMELELGIMNPNSVTDFSEFSYLGLKNK